LDKIDIYKIYIILDAIRPHFCDSRNITKQKKMEKIMQCLSIKSPLLYNNFLKEEIYYTFILLKIFSNRFFEWNFIQKVLVY
jgi:hypothetical protein